MENQLDNYIFDIQQILEQAKRREYSAVNTAMVEAYWLVGRRIAEEEMNGNERADYGKDVVKNISNGLSKILGKGFSERSIREFRQFYQTFPDLLSIQENAKSNLSISILTRVADTLNTNIQGLVEWILKKTIIRI